MKLAILSQQNFSKLHVSQDMIDAFESELCSLSSADVSRVFISENIFRFNRLSNKYLNLTKFKCDMQALQSLQEFEPDYLIVIAMMPNSLLFEMPVLKRMTCKKVAYCIDTWSSSVDQWKQVLTEAKIDIAFCAYKASVSIFSEFINKVYFLPQSFNPKWFYPRDGEKEYLLMQMGRKNSTLDNYALNYISDNNLSDSDYIREKVRGQVVFPSFSQLGLAISHTRFFILAPRSIDDTELTGGISDVTARFYEGMASKTLLIGYKPKDTFDELFPYENAMIEVMSYSDFKDKINYYLSHENEYRDIVDRNYQYVIENHTWRQRAEYVVGILQSLDM